MHSALYLYVFKLEDEGEKGNEVLWMKMAQEVRSSVHIL